MDKVCFNQVKKIFVGWDFSRLTIVDVGARDYNGSCRSIFTDGRYIGVDIEGGPNVDVVMPDSKTMPFNSCCADVVISLATLEHCSNPFDLMSEMARILKKDGTMVVCAPQVWGLHDYPHDYWRINPDGMRELFKVSGIKPVDIYTKSQITIRHGILKMTYGIGVKQ